MNLLENSASLRLLAHRVSMIEPFSRAMMGKCPVVERASLFSHSYVVKWVSWSEVALCEGTVVNAGIHQAHM